MELRQETIIKMVKELEERIKILDKECLDLEQVVAQNSTYLDETKAGMAVLIKTRMTMLKILGEGQNGE